jgi:hypothetical protein
MGGTNVFARQISVHYGDTSAKHPCPLKWLDNFSMRNFTNDAIFDDTLPLSDGLMEVGTRVPLDRLQSAMEEWFRKKSYLKREEKLLLREKVG